MNDVEYLGDGEEDLAYRPLSFEDDLFTVRVYNRNFGRPVIPGISDVKRQEGSEEFTPLALCGWSLWQLGLRTLH